MRTLHVKEDDEMPPQGGGRLESGVGAQPMGPPRSVLRPWSDLLPPRSIYFLLRFAF
jgi:hypothetical protein